MIFVWLYLQVRLFLCWRRTGKWSLEGGDDEREIEAGQISGN